MNPLRWQGYERDTVRYTGNVGLDEENLMDLSNLHDVDDDLFAGDDQDDGQQEAPPYIDPNEFKKAQERLNKLEQENAGLRQWQEDTRKAFGGQKEPEGVSEEWAQTVLSPDKFDSRVDQLVATRLQQQQAARELEDHYAKENPDLIPFKDYVMRDAAARADYDIRAGQYKGDDKAYIDAAISEFRQRQSSQQPSQGRPLREMALTMQTGATTSTGKKKVDIDSMTPEQFEEYHAKVKANFNT